MVSLADTFYYEVLTSSGSRQLGRLQADSLPQAREIIQALDIAHLLKIRKQTIRDRFYLLLRNFFRHKTQVETTLFLRILLDFLNAGITLERALSFAAVLFKNEALIFVHKAIQKGENLAKALEQTGVIKNAFVLNTIAMGASCGMLKPSLAAAIEGLERQHDLRTRLLKSISYPGLLFLVCLLLMFFMGQEILPQVRQLQSVLVGTNSHEVLNAGDGLEFLEILLGSFFVLCGFVFVLGLLGMVFAPYSSFLSHLRDQFCLRFWPIKWYVFSLFYAFYAALDEVMPGAVYVIASKLAGRSWPHGYGVRFQQVARDVEQGKTLANALNRAFQLEDVDVQILALGQETDTLQTQTRLLAKLYGQKLMEKLERITALLGPVALLCVGGMLLAIILSVFMPLYSSFALVESL